MDTPSPSDTPAPAQSALVPKRRRRWLRRLGWAALWLVTLYALFVVVENWRGRRAWNAYVAEMKSIGEPLDAAAVIPPPVPDSENFAMAPLFQPLFDYERDPKTGEVRWRNPEAKAALEQREGRNSRTPTTTGWRNGEFTDMEAWQTYYRSTPGLPVNRKPGEPARDILFALSKYDSQILALQNAASRPQSRFPVRYEAGVADILLPHYGPLLKFAHLLQVRALAHLATGQTNEAYDDLRLILRIASSVENEPLLISVMFRVLTVNLVMQPLWEGVMHKQFDEGQLLDLQIELDRIDFAAGYRTSLRGERQLFAFATVDSVRHQRFSLGQLLGDRPDPITLYCVPGGWYDQNKVYAGRLFQKLIASATSSPARFDPTTVGAVKKAVDHPEDLSARIYGILARSCFFAMGSNYGEVAENQTNVNLAIVALMLERHRLRHQTYPESLAALDEDLRATPRGVPPDCITGNPPHYALQPDGTYTLYYEGWNGTDDGGKVGMYEKGGDTVDLSKGDWVWPQPVEPY